MSFPSYSTAIERLGTWLVTAQALQINRTLYLENALPEAPDRLAILFEVGGTWDGESGEQNWRITLVTRAASLTEARAFTIGCIQGLLSEFKKASAADRGDIRLLALEALPTLRPRDDRMRVILETPFLLILCAPDEFGKEP